MSCSFRCRPYTNTPKRALLITEASYVGMNGPIKQEKRSFYKPQLTFSHSVTYTAQYSVLNVPLISIDANPCADIKHVAR